MKIISERQRVETKEFCMDYNYKDGDGGYSFECDSNGKILNAEHAERAKELDKDPNFEKGEFTNYSNSYMQPAIGICDKCGKEVRLIDQYMGACECECGQWYNMFGQQLKNPELWENEGNDSGEEIDFDL